MKRIMGDAHRQCVRAFAGDAGRSPTDHSSVQARVSHGRRGTLLMSRGCDQAAAHLHAANRVLHPTPSGPLTRACRFPRGGAIMTPRSYR